MNDVNTAIIGHSLNAIRIQPVSQTTVKQVRGFGWLLKDKIDLKTLRPAVMIQETIYFKESECLQTAQKSGNQ
jgi:hypothetical protein